MMAQPVPAYPRRRVRYCHRKRRENPTDENSADRTTSLLGSHSDRQSCNNSTRGELERSVQVDEHTGGALDRARQAMKAGNSSKSTHRT